MDIATKAYTQAKHDANKRYDAKTYKVVTFHLRLVEDSDILQSLEEAQKRGLAKREWLREIFEG